jgi:hypothetical protein
MRRIPAVRARTRVPVVSQLRVRKAPAETCWPSIRRREPIGDVGGRDVTQAQGPPAPSAGAGDLKPVLMNTPLEYGVSCGFRALNG